MTLIHKHKLLWYKVCELAWSSISKVREHPMHQSLLLLTACCRSHAATRSVHHPKFLVKFTMTVNFCQPHFHFLILSLSLKKGPTLTMGIITSLQIQCILQPLDHIHHHGPLLPMIMQTTQRNLYKLFQTLGAYGPLQSRIHRLINIPIMITPLDPRHQKLPVLLHLTLDGGPPTQYLQQNHTERVHIRLLSQPKTHVVLGIQIPETTLHVRGHDVGALHVAVDHALLVLAGVEELKPTRRLEADLQPPLPRERMTGVAEVVAECPTRHEIVDEDHFSAVVAVADEGNQVRVAEPREHLDLSFELVRALVRTRFEPLDGHGSVTRADVPFVHVTEPSFAHD
ncbi:hypothetical protein CR513_47959, partial [Mucuna pruriens]